MKAFEYARAGNLHQAIAAQGTGNAAVIAGGTEILNWMRLGIAEPDRLVDLAGLEGFDRIVQEGDHLRVGALATLNAVGEHPLVVQHARALAQACLAAASAQVRNRATLGGNVLQKTRCAYFRAEAPLTWGCNKRKPGSGCAARHGINERHAIFGWTEDCVAVQPSDPAVALACLDAELEVTGPEGARAIRMTEFYLTQEEAAEQGDGAGHETRLKPGEVIASYRIPLGAKAGSAYIKVRERESYEYALVSAAASIEMVEQRIAAARVALGSVAQRPWRLPQAEHALIGQALEADQLAPIIERAMADARPLDHNAYKVAMARNAAVRAILAAGGRS